jgi:hypothetical protein
MLKKNLDFCRSDFYNIIKMYTKEPFKNMKVQNS